MKLSVLKKKFHPNYEIVQFNVFMTNFDAHLLKLFDGIYKTFSNSYNVLLLYKFDMVEDSVQPWWPSSLVLIWIAFRWSKSSYQACAYNTHWKKNI